MGHLAHAIWRGMEGASSNIHKVFPSGKHWVLRGYPNGVCPQDVTPIAEGPRKFFVYHTTVGPSASYRLNLKGYYFQHGWWSSHLPYIWSRHQGDRRPACQASGKRCWEYYRSHSFRDISCRFTSHLTRCAELGPWNSVSEKSEGIAKGSGGLSPHAVRRDNEKHCSSSLSKNCPNFWSDGR